ncbi:MAG: cytidine deaminase [Bacteroidota bacterium]
MEKRKIEFELMVFNSLEEMTPADASLLRDAAKAVKGSYAPYSNFRVGAALRLRDGQVILGSNQENASFPAGLCAEGVAIFHAGANYPGEIIETIAITAVASEDEPSQPVAPCGICRQTIAEYEKKQGSPIAILMMGVKGKIYKCNAIADLLPLGFDNSFLGDS